MRKALNSVAKGFIVLIHILVKVKLITSQILAYCRLFSECNRHDIRETTVIDFIFGYGRSK